MQQHQISVVVPCVNALSDFRSCAVALQSQTGPAPEIVAVERLGPEFVRQVEAEFPDVRIVTVASGSTIPEMRAVSSFAPVR